MTMTPKQDEAFATFLRDKAMEAHRALAYRPNNFLKMLGSLGSYQTAVTLLSKSGTSEGFTELWRGGRLDLSVEAIVLDGRWRACFDQQLLQIAEKRLKAVGYVLPSISSGSDPHHPVEGVQQSSGEALRRRTLLPFVLSNQYSRSQIFAVLGLTPEPVGGPWFTGYVAHAGDCFIFCNVGAPGRTGHDYDNHFDGDRLVWFGKRPSTLQQPSIKQLLAPEGHLYVFYRFADRDPFTFAGVATPDEVFDTTPVKVHWRFSGISPRVEQSDPSGRITVTEGGSKMVTVKVYERDRGARLKCIGAWGWKCCVCEFDFVATYGELGESFIHVHHVKPLSEIGESYALDPVNDLRPVCPNCHAMLHRRVPALSILELKERLTRIAKA